MADVVTVFQVEAVSREEKLERFVEWLRCFAPLVPTAGDRRKILMGAIDELGPRPGGEKSDQREGEGAGQ